MVLDTVPKEILDKNPCLDEWAILSAYRGSVAHNMYVPNSDPNSIDDKDTMTVCVPPKAYYFGYPPGFGSNQIFPTNGTKEIKEGEWDIVAYEAKKFIGLLAQGNPNVLSLLWVDEAYLLKFTAEGGYLRQHRGLFVGKHVYHSFVGYANGQLHRMTHFVGRGYMGEKRGKLVEKYGFDVKNACHLIRLLRMGIEFLNTGELLVTRPDAAELLEIKRGEWSIGQVEREAERLFRLSEEAWDASRLPERPDYKAINQLSMTIIENALIRQERVYKSYDD